MVCHLCGAHLAGGQWVVLNRYAVGGRKAYRMVQSEDRDDGYGWDPDRVTCSGTRLCLRPCLLVWVEGKAIEVDWMVEHRDGE